MTDLSSSQQAVHNMKTKTFITTVEPKRLSSAPQNLMLPSSGVQAQQPKRSRRSIGLTEAEAMAFEKELAKMRGIPVPTTPTETTRAAIIARKPMSAPSPLPSQCEHHIKGKMWSDMGDEDTDDPMTASPTPSVSSASTTSLSTIDTTSKRIAESVVTGSQLISTHLQPQVATPNLSSVGPTHDDGLGHDLGPEQLRLTHQGKLVQHSRTNDVETVIHKHDNKFYLK